MHGAVMVITVWGNHLSRCMEPWWWLLSEGITSTLRFCILRRLL